MRALALRRLAGRPRAQMRRFSPAARLGTRLLFKSPPHTLRLAWLAEAFPRARFVLITRHPLDVVRSTQRMWARVAEEQGFQRPGFAPSGPLEPFVLQDFGLVERELQRQLSGLERRHPSGRGLRFCAVRYEDLDPAGGGDVAAIRRRLRTLLADLDLPPVLSPGMDAFLAWSRASYRKNVHRPLAAGERERVRGACAEDAANHGYELGGHELEPSLAFSALPAEAGSRHETHRPPRRVRGPRGDGPRGRAGTGSAPVRGEPRARDLRAG